MAWEKRKRGGRYYYRSIRVNGRVVKEYVGAGLAGQEAARQDEQDRAKRQNALAAVQRTSRQLEKALVPLEEFASHCDVLVSAKLLITGHKYHRGEWRRKQDGH